MENALIVTETPDARWIWKWKRNWNGMVLGWIGLGGVAGAVQNLLTAPPLFLIFSTYTTQRRAHTHQSKYRRTNVCSGNDRILFVIQNKCTYL